MAQDEYGDDDVARATGGVLSVWSEMGIFTDQPAGQLVERAALHQPVNVQEHRYEPGWREPGGSDTGLWEYITEGIDMADQRYCYACGKRLIPEAELVNEPTCSGCNHPPRGCPCACIVDH